jgi:BRCA1 C Terminus (BRCT) domain
MMADNAQDSPRPEISKSKGGRPPKKKILNCHKRKQEFPPQEEALDLVNQYLEPNQSSISSSDSVATKFLAGKYILICGYNDMTSSGEIIDLVQKFGGNLVDENFHQLVDYVITPMEVTEDISPPIRYKAVVTELWVEESLNAGRCIEPAFYHTPIVRMEDHEKPLKGEVFVNSNYKGTGRDYINRLVGNLAGIYREVMKKNEGKILISPNAEGKKFESAKLWGWTVLTAEWLLECQAKKWRVDETPYLIGGTKASDKNRLSPRKSIVPSSQEIEDYYDPPIENVVDNEPVNPRRISTPKTPATQDSTRPEIPDCMKPTGKDYGIRPNSTPNSQAFHKRKLEGLDLNYIAPAEKKRTIEIEEQTVSVKSLMRISK